jgi:hypothetical protein
MRVWVQHQPLNPFNNNMASRSQLSKYFNDGSREQVDLNLGQQQLDPRVTAGGQYRVAVQDTVRAEDTAAGRLASALQNVNPALKAYGNLNYQMGKDAAAAASPEELEKMLKEENPNEWLRFGRQKGVYDVGVKRDFNHNVLPVLKLKESSFLDVDTYKTSEELAQGIDEFEVEQWEQYQERLGEGMGNSLQAKALWQGVFSEWRGNVESDHIKATNTYNLTGLEDEQHNILNAATEASKTNGTVLDHSSNIRGTLKRITEQGSEYGLSKKDLNESSRDLFNSRAQTLINNGEFNESQRLLDAMNNYKSGGQSVFRTPENDLKISRMQKQITDGQDSEDRADKASNKEKLQNDVDFVFSNLRKGDGDSITDTVDLFVQRGWLTNEGDNVETFKKDLQAEISLGASPQEALTEVGNRLSRNLGDAAQSDYRNAINNFDERQVRVQKIPKTNVSSSNDVESAKVLENYQTLLDSGTGSNPQAVLAQSNLKVDIKILEGLEEKFNYSKKVKAVDKSLEPTLESFKLAVKLGGGESSLAANNVFYDNVVENRVKPIINRMASEPDEEKEKSRLEIKSIFSEALVEQEKFEILRLEVTDLATAQQAPILTRPDKELKLTGGETLNLDAFANNPFPSTFTTYEMGMPISITAGNRSTPDRINKTRKELATALDKGGLSGGGEIEGQRALAWSLQNQSWSLMDEDGNIDNAQLKMLNTSNSDLWDNWDLVAIGLETPNQQRKLIREAASAVTKRAQGQKLSEEEEDYYEFASLNGLIISANGTFNKNASFDLEKTMSAKISSQYLKGN